MRAVYFAIFVFPYCFRETKKHLTISGQVLEIFGEPCRIRTCDLLIKSQLLYQLS